MQVSGVQYPTSGKKGEKVCREREEITEMGQLEAEEREGGRKEERKEGGNEGEKEGGREGKEGEKEGGKEGRKEGHGGKEGERKEERKRRRKRRKEGGRKGRKKGGKEGRREGGMRKAQDEVYRSVYVYSSLARFVSARSAPAPEAATGYLFSTPPP